MKHYPPKKPKNAAGHWSADRDRATQARFRKAVLEAADHQCQYVGRYSEWNEGVATRCLVRDDLQAHHLEPGNDDPRTGVALCRYHHRMVDSQAR